MTSVTSALAAAAAVMALAGLTLTVGAGSASAATGSSAAGAGAARTISAGPARAAIGSTAWGWPYGCQPPYACLYESTAGAYPSGPHWDYFRFGSYNVQNVYGYHWIVNNQVGGAKVYLCIDFDGNLCSPQYVAAGSARRANFTLVNSIRLTP